MLREMVEGYAADLALVDRAYPVSVSAVRLERLEALRREWRETVDAVDVDGLPAEERVDWVLLDNFLERQGHALERERADLARARPHVPFLDTILELTDAHRAHRRPAPYAVASDLAGVLSWVEDSAAGGIPES